MANSYSGVANSLSGLQDKLFWRQVSRRGIWHCFKRVQADRRQYEPLCDKPLVIFRTGGQRIARPPSWLRCPTCDGLEMQRRGWTEGGPDSKDWADFRQE